MHKPFDTLGRLSLCAAGLAPAAAAGQQPTAPPNVIIIYADDLGFGDLSCNGSRTIATPNADRAAREGVRFTNVHTVASTSTPARYGLLTGQYPWRKPGTGIAAGDAGMIISPEQYTLADLFKSAGYVTGAVGKWHLGLGETARQQWNGEIAPGLRDIGFDYSFIMAATGDRVPCVYIENQRVVNLDPEDPIAVSYEKPFPGEPTGRDNPELLRMTPSHGHDQAIVHGIPRIGYMKGGKSALWRDEEIADRITEKALGFIADNRGRPFFLYLGTNDIHVPRVPHERFAGRSGMGPRGDAVLSFDHTVGKVLDALDSLGLADNTLLIISSDNGPVVDDGYNDRAAELLGDHRPWGDFRGGKYSAFEAGTRVPFIVRWPGHVAANRISDALLSHIDLYASLAALCGAALPEGAAPDSRNHLGTLLGTDSEGAEYVVGINLSQTLSVISDGWKYIAPSNAPARNEATDTEMGNDPAEQLYDLRNDPGERRNVAAGNPEEVARLKALLDRIKARPSRSGR
ncbi:MAG TPA: arylsulfatase [Candidatus Alistipes stercoripullorum]|nr:arylsulfatase [Candidatus Alistipes stercoripullorum]